MPLTALTQNGFPKRIVLNGDTCNCYSDPQVRIMAKTIVKVEELSKENRLLKKQSELHAQRVTQLMSATDSLANYIVVYREIINRKDTVIHNFQQAVDLQKDDIKYLERKIKVVRRKGIVRTVTTALTGVAVGIFTGLLLR